MKVILITYHSFQVMAAKKRRKNNGNSAPKEIESEYEDASVTESVTSTDMDSAAGHDNPVNKKIVFLKKNKKKQNRALLSKQEATLDKSTSLEGLIHSLQVTIASLEIKSRYGGPITKSVNSLTTAPQIQMPSATVPTKSANKQQALVSFKLQQQPPQASLKKQVSSKIPPVVVIEPPEDFSATQSSITNSVSKDLLVKKSKCLNHLIKNKEDYVTTKVQSSSPIIYPRRKPHDCYPWLRLHLFSTGDR